ncbi:MAG: glycoside hydrolase family 3 C-terminal domain-containing protein [Spirochaetales bacterium]|nr:glycoside hydrolase family 3 C-terminal domain-containing protein [Spirochaetales bacterium]
MRKVLSFIFTSFILCFFLFSSCAGYKEQTIERAVPPPDAPYRNPGNPVSERIEDLLSRMTLEEKIGQMTQIDKDYLVSEKDIAGYCLGSLLSGGGSQPKTTDPEAWADMYDRYQQMALESRLNIPIIYGIDAIHGNAKVWGAVVFPHNIGMGCMRNPGLVEEAARITAEEVAATGIDWTFSPCIAVPRDERWGRTYEGFGETSELAEIMGAAAVAGYQGDSLLRHETILACAKHYCGDGGTENGKDQGDTVCDEAALRKIHLPGYIKAVEGGVGSIMVSFSSWNGEKLHGHTYLLTDVLKEEIGFSGILVSDWKAIEQLPGSYYDNVTTAVNAGLDMIMVPDDYRRFISTLKNSVEKGAVELSRIDDAVERILRVKFELGLFEHPLTKRELLESVGSASHREIARECVRQSLVLLKNSSEVLPLKKNLRHIHVAGRNADDLGAQCGGWTMGWQGRGGNITKGTTILQAVRDTVSSGTKVTYSKNGNGAEGADVGIIVIGEEPYAEFKGDRSDLGIADADIKAIRATKGAGIPVVVVLISGRPMIITPSLESWDAFIAAWLPGTEGQGVADVIFGDYNPTGKLSHTWPRSMDQIPINEGDTGTDPLFPYGFGLSYR